MKNNHLKPILDVVVEGKRPKKSFIYVKDLFGESVKIVLEKGSKCPTCWEKFDPNLDDNDEQPNKHKDHLSCEWINISEPKIKKFKLKKPISKVYDYSTEENSFIMDSYSKIFISSVEIIPSWQLILIWQNIVKSPWHWYKQSCTQWWNPSISPLKNKIYNPNASRIIVDRYSKWKTKKSPCRIVFNPTDKEWMFIYDWVFWWIKKNWKKIDVPYSYIENALSFIIKNEELKNQLWFKELAFNSQV